MSNPALKEWLRMNKRELILGSLFFLISSISFALGFLASGELERSQIVVERDSELATTAPTPQLASASIIDQVRAIENDKNAKISVKKEESDKPIVNVAPSQSPAPVTVSVQPIEPEVTVVAPSPAPTSPSPSPSPAPSVPPPAPPPITLSPIQISEVSAGTESNSDDEFIELFNPNSVAVSLTGYSIKKRSSTGSESALVSISRLDGKTIPANKHFLIVHEGAYQGGAASDATWPASYDLAYKNNAVILYDPNGNRIFEVTWAELQKGMSSTGTPSPQNSSQ